MWYEIHGVFGLGLAFIGLMLWELWQTQEARPRRPGNHTSLWHEDAQIDAGYPMGDTLSRIAVCCSW
jgi:hypothetical protein